MELRISNTKMTGEAPEVRSHKSKPREDRIINIIDTMTS